MIVDGGSLQAEAERSDLATNVESESVPGSPARRVSVVTVAYGAEPWLERSVAASLASTGVVVEVVVVDNGCTDGAVERLRDVDRVTVLEPGANVGFAEGCNLGAGLIRAPVVAFVNPDAIVEPTALRALVDALDAPDVGIATCSLRLADRPELLNSAGNEIHFLGLSWSGSFERPASERDEPCDVIAASGAGMAVRRDLWEELGGFVPEFFAYQEDAELSLRSWISGHRVVFVPDAVVVHRYEFSRSPTKFFLLDRNRLLFVLTVYSRRLLLLLAPGLILQEVAMFLVAAVQGWLPHRLRAVAWVIRERSFIADRRRTVAKNRGRSDSVVAPMMARYVQPGNHPLPRWAVVAQTPLAGWWWVVRRLL